MNERRKFFRTVLAGLGAAVIGLHAPAALAKKFGLKFSQLPKLKKVGGSATIKLGGKQILLARVSEQKMIGVAAECTHQKCFVNYDPKRKKVACGCHGSFFDVSGKVLNGPATKSLASYPVTLDGERIIVSVPE